MGKKQRNLEDWERIAKEYFLSPQACQRAEEPGLMIGLFRDSIDKKYSLFLVKEVEKQENSLYHQRLLPLGKDSGKRSRFVNIGKACSRILKIPFLEDLIDWLEQ